MDAAAVQIYLDGDLISAPGPNIGPGSFSYQPASSAKLDAGLHAVRLLITDADQRQSEKNWSFTVTKPALSLAASDVYWPTYSAYISRELRVDYHLAETDSGACSAARVEKGIASGGVLFMEATPFPLGSIAAGGSIDFSSGYRVPAGIGRFMAKTYIGLR